MLKRRNKEAAENTLEGSETFPESGIPESGIPESGISEAGSEATELTDTLPEDIDVATARLDYTIPNNSRRRLSGAVYIFCGIVFGVVWLILRGGGSPLVNAGFLACSIALLLLGAHHIWTGVDLLVDDKEALVRASGAVGFSVGHASAQLGWRGWLSKPTWKVLLYSNEPQPAKRALVRLDGVSGAVVDMLEEDNPEDWAEFLEEPEHSENTGQSEKTEHSENTGHSE